MWTDYRLPVEERQHQLPHHQLSNLHTSMPARIAYMILKSLTYGAVHLQLSKPLRSDGEWDCLANENFWTIERNLHDWNFYWLLSMIWMVILPTIHCLQLPWMMTLTTSISMASSEHQPLCYYAWDVVMKMSLWSQKRQIDQTVWDCL